jgi:hypothetical protein
VCAAGSDRHLAGDAKFYLISVTSCNTMLELLGTQQKIEVNKWITMLVSKRGQKAREEPSAENFRRLCGLLSGSGVLLGGRG